MSVVYADWVSLKQQMQDEVKMGCLWVGRGVNG